MVDAIDAWVDVIFFAVAAASSATAPAELKFCLFYLQSLLKVTGPYSVDKLAAHCLAVRSARSLMLRVAASFTNEKQFCLTPDLVYVGLANWRCLV